MFRQVNEMTDEKRDFNKEAATWDEPRRIAMANEVADAILDQVSLTPDMDILDFGCGTGLLTMRLQPLARSITGVDSSQGMIDVLKTKIKDQKLANVRTLHLDIEKGDLIDGSYNLITSSMTLHHIKDIQPLLGQFFKAIRPGGYLCIADLDLDDGQFHGGNNDGVFHDGFDRAVMRQMFASAGFVDVGDRTAATVVKPVPGGTRSFTVFLTSGRKKA
jgi:ubiquinone/menaquinone biosynthesis C-methylase UbiE